MGMQRQDVAAHHEVAQQQALPAVARFDAALYRFVIAVLRPVVAAALGLRVTGREHLAGVDGESRRRSR